MLNIILIIFIVIIGLVIFAFVAANLLEMLNDIDKSIRR